MKLSAYRRREPRVFSYEALPQIPIVLALGEEVREIQARRIEANKHGHWRVLDEDTDRLDKIANFLGLFEQVPRRYGMTTGQYLALLESQRYACAICELALCPERPPVIDHNHDSGAVRGVLCLSCNVGIGHLQDSPFVLDAALAYLEERGFYGRGLDDD